MTYLEKYANEILLKKAGGGSWVASTTLGCGFAIGSACKPSIEEALDSLKGEAISFHQKRKFHTSDLSDTLNVEQAMCLIQELQEFVDGK